MLPSSPATAFTAIRLLRETASHVGEAVREVLTPNSEEFDKVLRPSEPEQEGGLLSDLEEQFATSAQRSLTQLGLSANQFPRVSVQPDGAIRVEGNVSQAARIEATLNHNPELRELAKQIAKRSGGALTPIALNPSPDLTSFGSEMNIPLWRR